ncbi:MAG: glycosyltransferase family 4 protein [Vicinamibacterales bacterium]
MRLVIDFRAALRERSGVGEYVYELVRALLALPAVTAPQPDLAVTLFSSSARDRLRPDPALGGARLVDRHIPVRLLNLLWHRLGWPPADSLVGSEIDVSHSLHPLIMPARRAAHVVTIHDLNFLLHPERTQAEIRRDYPALARAHAHRADRVVVVSRFTATQVQTLLGVPAGKISVCSPGAPAWPARAHAPRDGYVLFLGTLEARKNVGALLDAYEILIGRRRAVPRLLLAGRATPHANRWLERIARPPLDAVVTHLGYVDPDTRRELYEGAAVLVQPSFEEGFGIPLLEAMTVGVPVIAAATGALPEVGGDAPLFVDPHDPDSIAEALARTLDDPALAAGMTARGLARAASFSWHGCALSTLDAYRAAVGSQTAVRRAS